MTGRKTIPEPLTHRPVRRIAVFRALHLGDLLLAVPALRSLRAGFPGAEITLISLPWAEVLVHRLDRYIDRFVPFQGYPGLREVEVVPDRVERFLAEQRAYRYDLAVQLHGSGEVSNRLILALGANWTAGFHDGSGQSDLTVQMPYPRQCPELERNLCLARALGCPDLGTALEFPLLEGDRAEAARLLTTLSCGRRPWVGVHAGARAPARRWMPERFAQVADLFARRHGAQIVLTGGPDEMETAGAVERAMQARPLNLAGRTTLGGLAGVLARLDLFISNDTGPAHLATALDGRSITIFGPEDPVRWAPLDMLRHPIARHPVPCSPCGHSICPIDHRCLRGLDVESVIGLGERLLAPRGAVCNA